MELRYTITMMKRADGTTEIFVWDIRQEDGYGAGFGSVEPGTSMRETIERIGESVFLTFGRTLGSFCVCDGSSIGMAI